MSTGNLCQQGRGWGYDNNGIWVDRGCRARIQLRPRRRRRRNWGRPGEITCESNGYRYSYCNADTQGRVSLVREISTGNLCRQGRGWGYDNGGIWVDRGCRGEFRYGRDSGGRNDAAIAAGIIGAFAIGAAIGVVAEHAAAAAAASAAATAAAHAAARVGDRLVPGATTRTPATSCNSWSTAAGSVYLRNEIGDVVSQGDLRDGMVYWGNGKRSWLAREGPGVLVGDVDTGKHFYFRRNG